MSHPHERRGEIGGSRRPGPERSFFWHALWRVDWVWRRVVPVIAIVLALVAILGLRGKVDRTQSQVDAQREGRRVALEVICGALYGVEEAGRLILLGELPPPAPPTPHVSREERDLRDRYARSYTSVINLRVLEAARIRGKQVFREDGTLDCDKLKDVAQATSHGAGDGS